MIRAKSGNVIVLGLSRVNCERLMAGMPISLDATELGFNGRIVIFFGETEQAMAAELTKQGLISDQTTIDDRFSGRGNH
jgi:hypothetical protein